MKLLIFSVCFSTLFLYFVKAENNSGPSLENAYKQLSESLDNFSKKFQEMTGLHTEFDKEKFFNFLKSSSSKFQESYSKLVTQLEKDAKPYTEELKKSYENVIKQFNETVKNYNSADTQAKVQKLHETFHNSLKKLAEQANEVGKSAGVQIPPSMQKIISEMYDEIQKVSIKIQEKSQKLVEEAQAELKKKKN